MNNLKETIQLNLVGKEVNQTTILKAIKSAYKRFNLFESEEEAISFIAENYEVDPSEVTEQDTYYCELDGRVLDNQTLSIDGAEADYISSFKVSLTSYSHDSGMDEEDYAILVNIIEY